LRLINKQFKQPQRCRRGRCQNNFDHFSVYLPKLSVNNLKHLSFENGHGPRESLVPFSVAVGGSTSCCVCRTKIICFYIHRV